MFNQVRNALLCGILALALVAMGCDETKVARPTTQGSSPWKQDHWTQVKPAKTETGRVDPRYGRKARRISVTHLQTLIPKLFNGLDWTDSRSNRRLVSLARTLGQADYIYQTHSHRNPTPLFMKFMEDMAGQVCKKAVDKDATNKDTKTRMIMRFERDPDRNLRYLRLKFHTIYVPEDSTDGIRALRDVYDKALAASHKAKCASCEAWRTVCVAMVSSPEFFSY